MNGQRQLEVQYVNSGFPYTASQGFMDLFEGLSYAQVDFVHAGTSHSQVSRLKDAMTQIYPKLQEIKESVQSEFRHQVSLLIQPMLQSLDAAFAHYEAEMQRTTKRSERSNGFF